MDIELTTRLSDARSVLVAGCGGGFDIYCGVPLALYLMEQGKTVHLANLTFTSMRSTEAREVEQGVFRVLPDNEGPNYFPEKYLLQSLREIRRCAGGRVVWCLERQGV